VENSKKKIPPDMHAFMRELVKESLRDWFKKEKWVRISSSGDIAGPCGTSKNKKNPDRCLPKAKAQSLTKGERAATARKKKAAGAKGKTVVANTRKAKVTREQVVEALTLLKEEEKDYTQLIQKVISKLEDLDRSIDYVAAALTGQSTVGVGIDQSAIGRLASPGNKKQTRETANPQDGKAAPYGSGYKKVTREDIRNLVVGTISELKNENTLLEKDDRCTRIAKSKYDTWPSAYASGAVVRCRRGEIWKDVKEQTIDEMNCKYGSYFCPHDKVRKCRKAPKKSK
jgi:hypothetical protein